MIPAKETDFMRLQSKIQFQIPIEIWYVIKMVSQICGEKMDYLISDTETTGSSFRRQTLFKSYFTSLG